MRRTKMSAEEKRAYMLETPLSRLIPRMALPSIAAMLVSSLYNMADTYFVSSLGTYATGAVGVNASIDMFIMMGGSLLATGCASFTSRLLGAKRDEQARRVLSTCFFISLALGVLVMALGKLFMDPLLRLLGASSLILPYSRQYAQYVLLAAPFMAGSFILNQGLRAEGNAIFSMIGMIFGAVLNCGLDPIFIFVFGWGVAGASAATAISKLVSFCILLTPYLRRRTMLRIHLKYFRINVGDALEVIRMGSPSLLRTGLSTLASIVLNKLAVGYGESALAAVSVSNRVTMFLTSACLGFGQGLQPVAGFSWGAQRYDRIRESYRFSVKVATIGCAVPSLLIFIFARRVLLLFTENDLEMVKIGVFSLRVQCAAMPFHVWAIIVNMLCAGMGQARGAALLGMSRQGLCFFPILPLMTWLLGVWGVASVQGAADILTIVLVIPISLRVNRDLRRLEAEKSSASREGKAKNPPEKIS